MQKNFTNQTITPYEELIQAMNDIMAFHNAADGCSFTSGIWKFESTSVSSKFVLDFTIFDLPEFNGEKNYTIWGYGGDIELTNQEFAKVLFLEHIEKSATLYFYHRNGFNFIAKLCAFLSSYDFDCIDKSNVLDFYSYAFRHKIQANKIVSSFSPPAFQSLTGSAVSLSNLSQYLRNYHADGLIGAITLDTEQSALNDACEAQLGMNLSEYRNGASFNYLGLDIGKHYVDHCGSFFEENIQYAVAARKALNETITEVKKELNQGTLDSIQPVVAQALLGEKLSALSQYQSSIWTQDKLELIYAKALKNFIKNYNEYASICCAFKLDVINEIIRKTKLPERYDSQEFVRSMLFGMFINNKIKTCTAIFKEYFAVLKSAEEAPALNVKEFMKICKSHIETSKQSLPKKYSAATKLCYQHANKTCLESDSIGVRKLKVNLNAVVASGATLVVGLLGWRRSEYGFSLSDIKLNRNETVLDNFYTPIRFNVNWTVKKTSGETKLDREITLHVYLVLYLLDKLNESENILPAIYFASKSRSKGKKPTSDSSSFIASLVDILWADFIKNYSEKNTILNGSDEQLIKEFKKLEVDLPIYQLCQTNNSKSFLGKLEQYRSNELGRDEAQLLDIKLTESTKEKLKNKDVELTPTDVKNIRLEVMQDIAYPTAHAFRHVWAEAVLRRYRGDIGKFIRANFKHLDESFFMAYLRDKETKAVYQVAKRTTINVIVRQQLFSLTNNDRAFSGGFDRMVTASVNSTKVISNDEYIALANRISEERILNISPRPWVTCMLRVNTESFAKCSEDGEPQPHKAEPKFCLGCINANIADGNFNGIVLYIKVDIDACRNPELPAFIRKMHEPVVRDALKRIKELARNTDKYNEFINHLEDTLTIAAQLNRAA
ncbi:MAG: hypothetical protein ACPG5R_04120 [Cognaticolwellia aestuarii]